MGHSPSGSVTHVGDHTRRVIYTLSSLVRSEYAPFMNVSVSPPDASSRSTRVALSVDDSRLFVAAVLLAIVPLWFGRYLPMVDLAGHAAVISALQEIAAGNQTSAAFEAHWTSPYLIAYARDQAPGAWSTATGRVTYRLCLKPSRNRSGVT